MRIVKMYSHLNGHEHILVHKPHLWTEITDVIAAVDAEACRTKISKEKRTLGQTFYSPIALNQAFKAALPVRGWQESRTSYWVTGDHRLIRQTIPLPADE